MLHFSDNDSQLACLNAVNYGNIFYAVDSLICLKTLYR